MKLHIEIFNGKEFLSLVQDNYKNSRDSNWRSERGLRMYQPLTDEQSKLSLDTLREMFFKGEFDIKPDSFTIKVKAAISKRNDLLKRLDAIIKTSNQHGEVENCKDLWRKLVKKDWPER